MERMVGHKIGGGRQERFVGWLRDSRLRGNPGD